MDRHLRGQPRHHDQESIASESLEKTSQSRPGSNGSWPGLKGGRSIMSARTSITIAFLAFSVIAQAQSYAAAGCSLVKGRYQCDQVGWVKALANARTVLVETQPFDRNSQRRLAELATELGKTTASDDADLVFRLERLDPENNVYYGPNGRDLATLRVYSHGSQSARGPLIWAETFTGQPDMPWPTVVHQLIQQFKSDTK
jgi:hypothetical protein